jgi:superfamily I DNA/RNA helicase
VSGPLDTAIAALTDEQRLAVEHPGNFSLLARPGSGKTRVVGLRLARAAVTRDRRVALASYTNVADDHARRRRVGSIRRAGVARSE